LDPLSSLAHYLIAIAHNGAGRYELGMSHAIQALEINPHFPFAQGILGQAQIGCRQFEEGIASMEKAITQGLDGWWAGLLGSGYVLAGREADAIRLLNDMEARRVGRYISPLGIAMIATTLGDVERGLRWLKVAVEEHDGWMAFLPSASYLKPLRSHPGFAEAMRSANLPVYQ